MGRDNSPKERQRKQLERKRNSRASYDRILIVSEGSKTEPNYFKEIRAEYRLHMANVAVHPSAFGTEPLQVVDYARELFENGNKFKGLQPRVYEQVYAVFDRDEHRTFHNALARAQALDGKLRNDLKKPVKFTAVPSRPCFEFWLLLHFEDIHHLIHRDETFNRLRNYIQDYQKGATGVFTATKDSLHLAITRAANIAARYQVENDDEPYTGVMNLVDLLTKLRN